MPDWFPAGGGRPVRRGNLVSLSRVSAPTATHDMAALMSGLLSSVQGAAPRVPAGSFRYERRRTAQQQLSESGERRPVTVPTGLGTSTARVTPPPNAGQAAPAHDATARLPGGPTGLGTSALRIPPARIAEGPAVTDHPADGGAVAELYCPVGSPVMSPHCVGSISRRRIRLVGVGQSGARWAWPRPASPPPVLKQIASSHRGTISFNERDWVRGR